MGKKGTMNQTIRGKIEEIINEVYWSGEGDGGVEDGSEYWDGGKGETDALLALLRSEIEKKKRNIKKYGRFHLCTFCGCNRDECSCSGYNQALQDVLTLLQ